MTTLTRNFSAEQLHEFFRLLQYSTMSKAEKKWWVGLLPEMNQSQFNTLSDILREEVDKMTNLSLKVTQMRNDKS
ncbi:MAG: hypothetical protein Q8P68_02905 [Candidatus Peregrinibacteria bacterium]|nr:hypothetical protein [Candidatus Peregrinibacteria bacterium]MDZ4245260.1 hypothetical protein [Candidatus Gracilibacteria bacterium]